jgi:aspartyl-tRNA(Asn)/glutamyl-tRNA(Gln) amidotransferase subunit A
MLQAGAVMVGKVNLDEFTYGSSNESSRTSQPAQPVEDRPRTRRSSGGSTPALEPVRFHFRSVPTRPFHPPTRCFLRCGGRETHIRPRFSLWFDRLCLFSGLPRPGGSTVSDAAAMLQVIGGADPHDATAPHGFAQLPVDDRRWREGMRIGLSPDYFRITYPDPKTETC